MNERGDACVIYNPVSGRGRSRRIIWRLQGLLPRGYDYRPIDAPGGGEEMALKAIADGYRTIVAAGGDGTVHEIANGLLRARRDDVTFCVWPMGSANDYAYALGVKEMWSVPQERWESRAVDVGRIEADDGRSRYFVNCMGLGFNGAVTLEAQRIKWIRGMLLYGLGIIQALRKHFARPVMKVRLDDLVRETPTLALSLCLGKREGSFPLRPKAVLDDGLFDYIHAGPMTRWQLLCQLPNMATGKLPDTHPTAWFGRCRRASIESAQPLRVHIDGEFFCHPDANVRALTVTVLPKALRVVMG